MNYMPPRYARAVHPAPDSFLAITERSLDDLAGLCYRGVLPDADDSPSGVLERLCVGTISCAVARDLRLPVGGVRAQRTAVLGTAVPEAPVHEDRHASTWEEDVGRYPEVALGTSMHAKAPPASMELLSQREFGLGIAAPVASHDGRGGGRTRRWHRDPRKMARRGMQAGEEGTVVPLKMSRDRPDGSARA